MARASAELVAALRETATRLSDGAPYAWSKMGSCNCGHLAQTITRLGSRDIQRYALQRAGDWTTQAVEYCPESGLPMEHIFLEMMHIGLTRADIGDLEKLANPKVLAHIPADARPLRHNKRDDVVRYLHAWAALLEDTLLPEIDLSPLELVIADL